MPSCVAYWWELLSLHQNKLTKHCVKQGATHTHDLTPHTGPLPNSVTKDMLHQHFVTCLVTKL